MKSDSKDLRRDKSKKKLSDKSKENKNSQSKTEVQVTNKDLTISQNESLRNRIGSLTQKLKLKQTQYNDIKVEENAYRQLLEEKQKDLRAIERKIFEISTSNNSMLRDIARTQQAIENESLINMKVEETIDKILRINTSFSNVQLETKEKVGGIRDDIERMDVIIQELVTELECNKLKHKSLCNELAVSNRYIKRLNEEEDYCRELLIRKDKLKKEIGRMEFECEKLRRAIQNAKIVINERDNEVNDLLYDHKLLEEKFISSNRFNDVDIKKSYTPNAIVRSSNYSNVVDEDAKLNTLHRAVSGQKGKRFRERSSIRQSVEYPLSIHEKVNYCNTA